MQLHTVAILTVGSTVTRWTGAHIGRSAGHACSPVNTRLGRAGDGAMFVICEEGIEIKECLFTLKATQTNKHTQIHNLKTTISETKKKYFFIIYTKSFQTSMYQLKWFIFIYWNF